VIFKHTSDLQSISCKLKLIERSCNRKDYSGETEVQENKLHFRFKHLKIWV